MSEPMKIKCPNGETATVQLELVPPNGDSCKDCVFLYGSKNLPSCTDVKDLPSCIRYEGDYVFKEAIELVPLEGSPCVECEMGGTR